MVFQDEAERNILHALRGGQQMSTIQVHKVSGLSEPRYTNSVLQALCHEGLVRITRIDGKEMYSLTTGVSFDDATDTVKEAAIVNGAVHPPVSAKPALSAILDQAPPPKPPPPPPPKVEPVKPPVRVMPEQKASKFPGIYINHKSKLRPWKACAQKDGKTVTMGTFATEQEAIDARAKFLAERDANAKPKAEPVDVPPPAKPSVVADAMPQKDRVYEVMRLQCFSPAETMEQELVVSKLVRAELMKARAEGLTSLTVSYLDAAGKTTDRQVFRL